MNQSSINSQNYLPTSLRAFIIAGSYWLLSLTLTVVSGSVAAIAGCVLACFAVDSRPGRMILQQIRTGFILFNCILLILIGFFIAGMLVGSSTISAMFTAVLTFNIAESIKWFCLAGGITVILRILAQRSSIGAILEIGFVAAAFVITLSAHRNGMIHRPFFIGDFAITRGIDPSLILLMFGCGALLALSALLMVENNHRRLPYHFSVLGLLCFSLLVYIRMFGLPTPSLTDDLGLTGREQSGGTSSDNNPFRDGENNSEEMEAPVAIVVFRDDYEPESGSYYFRESAYSQFNGAMLDFASHPEMDRDLISSLAPDRVETEQVPTGSAPRSEVRTTIGMLVPHRSPFGLDTPVAYEETVNPNNLRFKRTYEAYSLVPEFDINYLLGRELGDAEWSDEAWQEYLTLPDDPRYQQLADNLITNLRPQFADDPFAKAWSIKTYLDENGIYSLKNEHAYADDPAASFLFGDLTGYCMHFAFAATYMFRSLGIPARVGIGYSVPAANRAGGSALLIQAIHGHAWPEIYFKDIGWVIVDPAPQQTLVDMTTDPQNDLQQLLGDMLRNEAAFEDFLESQQGSPLDLTALLNGLYVLLALVIAAGYTIKAFRLYAPTTAPIDSQYRTSYRAILDRLTVLGIRRREGESREQFAERVSEVSPTLRRLTSLHLAYALGHGPEKPVDRQQWAEIRRQASAEIARNSRFWQRLVYIFNPFSWVQTR